MHMLKMIWATSLLLRGIPRVSCFSTRPVITSRGSPPLSSLIQAHVFAFARTSSRLRSTASKHNNASTKKTKKGPKINKKRNKHLLRADRVLANRGWGSRSECTELLKRKRVFVQSDDREEKIVVKGPSEKLTMDAPLFVDNTPVPTLPLLLAYHKPKWVLSVLSDPQGRPNLGSLLSEVQRRQKMHPVGRLDYDSAGLLLFSTNGSLTQRLLHPTHEIEKEYVALVDGTVDRDQLEQTLQSGVETAEGVHVAELLDVSHVDSDQVPILLKEMRSKLPPEYNVTDLEVRGYLFSDTTALSRVRLKVSEGKHRMVRRMLANCGHGVVELKRERHGQVVLGDLPEGEFRELTPEEQEWAESLVSKQKGKKR